MHGFANDGVIWKIFMKSTRIDGVSSWKVFWNITLPLIKPTLVIAIIFKNIR